MLASHSFSVVVVLSFFLAVTFVETDILAEKSERLRTVSAMV
jgi:hypothetical protein